MATKVAASMPTRYDESKMIQTAQAQWQIVAALRYAFTKADPFEISWGDLPSLLPPRDELDSWHLDAGEGLARPGSALAEGLKAAWKPSEVRPPHARAGRGRGSPTRHPPRKHPTIPKTPTS